MRVRLPLGFQRAKNRFHRVGGNVLEEKYFLIEIYLFINHLTFQGLTPSFMILLQRGTVKELFSLLTFISIGDPVIFLTPSFTYCSRSIVRTVLE
jgi:hypothetical protein